MDAYGALETLFASAVQAEQYEQESHHRRSLEEKAFLLSVAAYNKKRANLIAKEIKKRRLSWCTRCKTPHTKRRLGYVIYKGVSKESCGYEGGDYTFRHYSGIHRVCTPCRKKMLDRNGWRGDREMFGREQEMFEAREAMIRETPEGLLICVSGTWTKLDRPTKWDPPYQLPVAMPEEMTEALACAWGIPPRVEAKQDYPWNPYTLSKVEYKHP
jgi:hypothetical protein